MGALFLIGGQGRPSQGGDEKVSFGKGDLSRGNSWCKDPGVGHAWDASRGARKPVRWGE